MTARRRRTTTERRADTGMTTHENGDQTVSEKPLPTAEDDPRLLDVLQRAGEEWGGVRVALTAALISDPDEVVRALVTVRGAQ